MPTIRHDFAIKKFNCSFFLCLIFFSSFLNTIRAATYTVGAAGNYATLQLAFADINAGTITGVITLNVISNVSETVFPVVLNANSAPANYSSVLIQPVGGAWTISGSVNGIFLRFNGASNVTIDGKNLSGSPALVIENTNTASNSNISTIQFITGSNANVVKYCTLKGSGRRASPTPTGTVYLSTGSNHDIQITHCTITTSAAGTLPFNPIASLTGNYNITVSYCDIQDFNNAASTRNSFGIYSISPGAGTIGTGNTQSWVVDHNNFFQTGARSSNATGMQHGCIYFSNPSGNACGIDITNNVIGHTASVGSMDMSITYNGSDGAAPYFLPIYVTDPASGTTTNIRGNTIAGISFTTTSSGGTGGGSYWFGSDAPGIFTAITVQDIAGTGTVTPTVNIGGTGANRSDGNTIGLSAYPISLSSSSAGGAYVAGIWSAFQGTCNIQDNTVSAFRSSETGGGTMRMYGIALGNANPYAPVISGYCTGNKIYDFNFLVGSGGYLAGIEQISSSSTTGWTIANNMISLITSFANVWVVGLDDASQGPLGSINNYYYNSVYLGGVSSAGTYSDAWLSTDAGGSEENNILKNNVFYMDRTGPGTNYCIEYSSGFPPWVGSTWISNNNIFINTQSSTIGNDGASAVNFNQWKTNTGGDANSFTGITPNFFTNVATGDLHITWDMSTSYPGVSLAIGGVYPLGIDIDPQNRNNPPDIGADEYGAVVVLNVDMPDFFGINDGDKNDLFWTTASEFNNDHFTVERSVSGKDYEPIGIVAGAGNSSLKNNYQFFDNELPAGVSDFYYRLRQTNFDGSYEFHGPVRLRVNLTQSGELHVQNDLANDELILTFPAPETGNYVVEIIDMQGRTLQRNDLRAENSSGVFKADVSGLRSGMYFVRVRNEKRCMLAKFIRK